MPSAGRGSGMANVYNAIHANAYLSVEGSDRPKAEVGSSAEVLTPSRRL